MTTGARRTPPATPPTGVPPERATPPTHGTAGAPGRDTTAVQRNPIDLVRVLLGLTILGVGLLIARRGQLSVFERDVFRIVNDLPTIVHPLVWTVMQLGNVVAVPVVALAAVVLPRARLGRDRFRMGRDLLVAGLLAYEAADLVKSVVGRSRPAGLIHANLLDGDVTGIGFVSGHASVAAAMVTAAVPYLTRRGRRVAWALAWTVALARVYVGAHLPLDVLGGLALGWAIGSLVHYLFGVPRWEPQAGPVAAMLGRWGVPVREIGPAAVTARSSHPFDVVAVDGRRLYVKVLDPDRYERDWLYRLYRVLVVRDIKDSDAVAPLGVQAEHEAVVAMTAREHGVRVPRVVLARGSDRGAVVVQEYLTGRTLDALPPGELTPELLEAVWQQIAGLRAARVAHHDLVASSVLVDEDGRPWVVDFGNAVTGADDVALDADLAEFMVSLSLRIAPATVVDSALDTLGSEPVAAALPSLAPLSLTAATRRQVRTRPTLLPALQDQVRDRLGLPDPQRPQFGPAGVLARVVVAVGSALVLLGVPILAGAREVLNSVEAGGWRWLGGALVLAFLARSVMAVAAMLTVDRRLSVGRAFNASTVAEGATLLHGRAGWRRAISRFLERTGVLPDAAQLSTDRFTAASIVAATVVAVVTLVLGVVEGRLGGWHLPEALVPAVALGIGGWALVLLGQWLAAEHGGRTEPRSVAGPKRHVRRALADAVLVTRRATATTPRRTWWPLLGSSVLGVALEAAALAAALQAVGGRVPLLATAAVYAVLHLLWSVVPVTGMPGAAFVMLMLGLMMFGAPLAAACAAVLTFRLLTFWIPAGLGALLSARFEHRLLT